MYSRIAYLLILLLSIVLLNCSKSDDQRKFENNALALPQDVTPTDAQGNVTGKIDAGDWNIGPMYQGLVQIKSQFSDYPHPNPLDYNQNLTLQIYFSSSDAVDAIIVHKFRFPENANFPRIAEYTDNELGSPVTTITIEGQLIAENSSSDARTTYRLMIYDGNQNLISYGDVRIK